MDNNYGQNAGNTGEQMNNGNYNGYNYNSVPEPYKEEPMTMGQWMITILVMMIPCVNIIMAFVWAFGNGNVSRKNYFKAYLIWMAIAYVLAFVLVFAFGAGLAGLSNSMYY